MMRRFVARLSGFFAERFDRSAIADVAGMTRFVRTRAAYVAQTSLYGYLKTRMGTSFHEHFQNDVFAPVIRAAAVRLFVSCLADLTVFAVATAGRDGRLSTEDAAALARLCFREALAEGIAGSDRANTPGDVFDRFETRLEDTIWANAELGEAAFAGSAADLIRVAPVVDDYKALDGEIVTNSIRFRWRDIREQFRKRADSVAICDDWRRRADVPDG